MSKPVRRLITICLLFTTCSATAGELHLDNGAVLPGELVSISSKALVWNADKIGNITVTKSDVVTLHTSSKIPVELSPHKAALTHCSVGVENSQWSVNCAEHVSEPVVVADLQSVPAATSSSGKLTTSLDIDRGANPSEELQLDLSARWLRPTHRHTVNVSVDYETSDGETTDDDADASYQYDLLRENGWYWFGRIRYYRDKFEALNEVYAVGGGIGRDFTPVEDLTLSLQGGPIEMYYYYDDHDPDLEPGAASQWSVAWQTPWRGIQVSHSGDLGWVFSIEDGYLFQSKTGLTFPLYKGLIAEVRLDYKRAGLSALDGKKYDMEWVLGLGYKW
jgi:putative salt-induced outer membrane protein YdiY